MATDAATVREYGLGKTQRRDAWWAGPMATALVLGSFIVYTTFRIFQNAYFQFGHGTETLPDHAFVLSPMYSPLLALPSWVPAWVSPAMLILWMPGGFRLTCYYYRKAYYRAFWADPPACAVGEPRKSYLGENSLPLILQNIHRYFLYVALGFVVVLWHDVYKAFWFTDPATGETTFGIGVGTLVLIANVTLLSGYTLGCHVLRHVVGGFKDRLSGAPVRKRLYDCSSCLNRSHLLWAWNSLFSVMFADIYVRLCSMGIWTDLRLL
jgi:hypothetical protein